MATKHRYEFECGHAANATNEQAMGNIIRLTVVGDNGAPVTQKARICPRCANRLTLHVNKIVFAPRSPRSLPLPKTNGGAS